MPDAPWKRHERRVAAALGTKRVGPSGQSGPDVVTDWLAVECKERRVLPKWITNALSRIRVQAGSQRLGIVVAHEAGARDSLVIMSFEDFRDWFGDA